MTLEIMRHFGVKSQWLTNVIIVKNQKYIPSEYNVESDWSSAAYWYSMIALSDDSAVFLKGLKRKTIQGDTIIKDLFLPFSVITEFSNNGIFISKGTECLPDTYKIIDFSSNPDLAQTFIVLCAAKNAKYKFTGLESLRIKETDRIKALQNELIKFNVDLAEETSEIFVLKGIFNSKAIPLIETYNDHRMAMSFAPLALVCDKIMINNPLCVKKSYPDFWKHLKKCGFKTL